MSSFDKKLLEIINFDPLLHLNVISPVLLKTQLL